MTAPSPALLEVQHLTTSFKSDSGRFVAVDDISFTVGRGATVGIVGESGCGKTATALSLLRLIADPPGRIESGRILYEGRDLLALPEPAMREIRGNKLSMVFQEPMNALNPVFPVGEQIAEAVRLHQKLSRPAARERALEMLRAVGIPAPEERLDQFPHQLSGGMRQRVAIAMALACNPDLLIADEPTTALDVTIQAQILDLLDRQRRERGMAVLLITHSLALVADFCDVVIVMYAGRIIERASVQALFARPAHPYTAGLLRSLPSMAKRDGAGRKTLATLPGSVPAPGAVRTGCRFRDRCDRASEACAREEPQLAKLGDAHEVSCFHPLEEGAALKVGA